MLQCTGPALCASVSNHLTCWRSLQLQIFICMQHSTMLVAVQGGPLPTQSTHAAWHMRHHLQGGQACCVPMLHCTPAGRSLQLHAVGCVQHCRLTASAKITDEQFCATPPAADRLEHVATLHAAPAGAAYLLHGLERHHSQSCMHPWLRWPAETVVEMSSPSLVNVTTGAASRQDAVL